MPVTLPVDAYEILEKKPGREDAKTLIKTLETTISDATDYKWKITKEELLDAIRKEFVTKELFEERMKAFEERMKAFEGKLQNIKELFEEKLRLELQTLKAELTTRFTVMFLILLFTIIFLNQNALEFIAKIMGLIK